MVTALCGTTCSKSDSSVASSSRGKRGQNRGCAGRPTSVEYEPVEAHIPKTFTTNNIDVYDYALITVNADLSNYEHFNLGSLYDLDASSLQNANLYAMGTPQYVHGESHGSANGIGDNGRLVYTGIGHIVDGPANPDSDILYLDADITYGDSGGPIFMQETYCIGIDVYRINTVVSICSGIHTNNNELYNMGPRFNSPILQFYRNNPNISY